MLDNQWMLTLNNSITPSNQVFNTPPEFNPVKEDTQKDPGRLRVALDDLSRRGDLRVGGLGECIRHTITELHVELGGHVLTLGVEHLHVRFVGGEVFIVVVVDDAGSCCR